MKKKLLLSIIGMTTLGAEAATVYMVNGSGQIRSWATGADLAGDDFADGTLVDTVAGYGSYQGFTQYSDGTIYGVNSAGGVDSWSSVASWTAGDAATNVSANGTYGAGELHGISYDGNTGGFYVVYEGSNAGRGNTDGDVGQYATLANFLNDTSATIGTAAYGGNITNFYYGDEDIPGSAGAPGGNIAGSNYLQVTGGGSLEGFLTLGDYIGSPNNRVFEEGGFSGVVGSFSVVAIPEPSSTALLGLGGLALILRRRK